MLKFTPIGLICQQGEKNMETFYHSTTYGLLTKEEMREVIIRFITQKKEYSYSIVIGTDSQVKNSHGIDFITALVVHRVGGGGIYFWKRENERKRMVFRNRIYQEAVYSLNFAQEVLEVFKKDGIGKLDIEIHVDMGNKGETRNMLSEVVGMIRGSGYIVKTKPDSYAASKVADRHT